MRVCACLTVCVLGSFASYFTTIISTRSWTICSPPIKKLNVLLRSENILCSQGLQRQLSDNSRSFFTPVPIDQWGCIWQGLGGGRDKTSRSQLCTVAIVRSAHTKQNSNRRWTWWVVLQQRPLSEQLDAGSWERLGQGRGLSACWSRQCGCEH